MANKIKDTDYLFLSARLRAMENRLLTAGRMERMLAAPDGEEAAKVLGECGYQVPAPLDGAGINRMLAGARDEMLADLARQAPDPRMVALFRMKYDYHNAKAILKGKAMGAGVDRLLVDSGRISGGELARQIGGGELNGLPALLAEGIRQSWTALEQDRDPQKADLLLDRAYYQELAQTARETGSPFLAAYVRLLVDVANLRSLVRVLRSGGDGGMLRALLLEGGHLPLGEGTLQDLESRYTGTPLAEAAALGREALSGGSLTPFERACDNAVMAYLSEAKRVAFGEAPLVAYLAAKESEFTAVRIILTGCLAGLPANVIRERLRDAYV